MIHSVSLDDLAAKPIMHYDPVTKWTFLFGYDRENEKWLFGIDGIVFEDLPVVMHPRYDFKLYKYYVSHQDYREGDTRKL